MFFLFATCSTAVAKMRVESSMTISKRRHTVNHQPGGTNPKQFELAKYTYIISF